MTHLEWRCGRDRIETHPPRQIRRKRNVRRAIAMMALGALAIGGWLAGWV